MSLRRTVVIGTSCSGKTTFARLLAKLLEVQHIELDAINWLPDWTPRPNEEFRSLVKEAVSTDEWVVDGNYSGTRDIVWPRATAVIWLNYSFPVVLSRAFSRTIRRVFDKEVLYSGNRETFRKAFLSKDSMILWVLKTYYRRRREYSQLLEELQGRLDIRVFRTPEDERFLSEAEKRKQVIRTV
jgi:adenylate kinase family enzyme